MAFALLKKEVYNILRYSNVHLFIGGNKILIPVYRHLQVDKSLFSIVYLVPQLQKTNLLSFDANVSSFSLAETPPRDLQITAYK